MKKLCLALAVFALIVSSSWGNMLTNGGFETGANEWTLTGYVSPQSWAIYNGTNGVAFEGWQPGGGTNGSGAFYQEVTNGISPGTYTFTVWARQETAFQRLTNAIQMGWYNAGGTKLQQDTTAYFTSVPSDPDNGDWHLVRVTGSCSSTELARVRVTVTSCWASAGGALMFDDANLYSGTYTGATLRNGSFEDIGTEVDRLRSRKWVLNPLLPPGGGWGTDSSPRSGTNGVALYSFASESNNYQTAVKQSVYPAGTGTYTFTVYMKREANFLLNTAGLSVQVYAEDYTNKVQNDISTNLTLPTDGQWHEYYISLAVTSPAAFELRPQIDVSWMYNTTSLPSRAAMIDDARWLSGAYTDALNTDWVYYSAPGNDPLQERVPGTNGFGPFLTVNYVTHTNTFYLLTDASQLARYPGEDALVQLRTAWQVPGTDTWVEAYSTMQRVATVGIPATNSFHGLPAAGTQEVAVWKCNWEQPRNPTNGVFYSNDAITVFYAPFIKTTNGIIETDYKFVTKLSDATTVTNNLGQFLGDNYASLDYSYLNCKGSVLGAFTNGGFENPTGAGPLTLSGSGWFGSPSGLERADWGFRSGGRALLFYGWNPGSARVVQDVATTGGMFSFSSYVKVESGVTNLAALSLRMEWYAADGLLAQVNEKSLLDIPRDSNWYPASVVGSCRATNLAYVRLSIQGEYGPSDAFGEAILFDDAQFLELSSQLQNVGFEDTFDGSGWFGGRSGRESWANRSGSAGAAFWTWDPGSFYLYQNVATTGGTHQFSGYLQVQTGAVPTALEIKMEWYDRNGSLVQENTRDLMPGLVKEFDWTHIGVVGSCSASNLEYVRLSVAGDFGDGTDGGATLFDDMEFAAVATNLQNGGFETGIYRDSRNWFVVPQWLAATETWTPNHSGTNLFGFHGWETNAPEYECTLSQPLAAVTGSYVFSAWIKRETGFNNLTNARLRIEWLDNTWSNKVQADSENVLSIPADDGWYQYAVTGSCSNASLRGIQVKVLMQWAQNTGPGGKGLMVDDLDVAFSNFVGDTGFTDGIPNTWWDRYGITGGGRVAANDTDADGQTHLDEYIGDTNPTNITSSFSNTVRVAAGTSVMTIQAGPPTTNSRVYDVWWKTNLTESSDWMPYNKNLAGDAGGGEVQFSVTNDAGKRFYRTGVKMP